MKKVVVFIVLAMVAIGSCTAQNTIVGIWTDVEGSTWTFSADGKVTYTDNTDGSVDEYQYSVFDGERRTELTISEVRYNAYIAMGITDQVYTVEFSKDGKTLRLTGGKDLNGWSVAGPGWSKNQLTKGAQSQPKGSQSQQSQNGVFTLTDIPSKYNGKYAILRGFNSGYNFAGGESYISTSRDDTYKASRISNGKVILPMWIFRTTDVRRFTGNDTLDMIFVCIVDSDTITDETGNDGYLTNIMFNDVGFSNGGATRSWTAGREVDR